MLAIALFLLAWQRGDTLRDAFSAARDAVAAMYPTRRRPGRCLEGFLKAGRGRSEDLLGRIVPALRARTREQAGDAWRWRGWVVLGVDGSRLNCPRTRANEDAFGCAGRRRTAPQQLVVTLFHVAGGLLWSWRRARGDGSERDLLLDMLPELPPRTLLLADAGYTGYRLLSALNAAGHGFVVRAGSNVTLLRKLGYHVRERGNTVYLWPQQQRRQPPLILRLVQLRSRRQRIALLTNVLDQHELRDEDAAALYRQRWSVEVMYRSLKQTLGKHKLRAETPELAACELDWALAGLWLLGLMAIRQAGVRQNWSPARALRVLRHALRHGRQRAGCHSLRRQLAEATCDNYQRRRARFRGGEDPVPAKDG